MSSPYPISELAAFLRAAKFATYATQGDSNSIEPLLPGSKQLEHQAGDFLYRDIYAGLFYFVGQEMVYYRGTPVWSMSYAGGMLPAADMSQAHNIYTLLRQALQQMPPERPLRGPAAFAVEPCRYANTVNGDIERFHGQEQIFSGEALLYELHYSGGLLV